MSDKIIDTIGDASPVTYGGGVIFKNDDGYYVEYTYGLEDDATNFDIEDTEIDTWFERDRAHVALKIKDEFGQGDVLVEWWDAEVAEAVEDGFLDPKDWHGSAFEYAEEHDYLDPIQQLEVFGTDVPDDVLDWHDWVDVESVTSTVGMEPAQLRKLSKSRKVQDRVWALEVIAATHGWGGLDHYPNRMAAYEIEERWELG